MPFPSASSRRKSPPILINPFTADNPPELAASNKGVDLTLKKIYTILDLITPHTPISAQSSNSVV